MLQFMFLSVSSKYLFHFFLAAIWKLLFQTHPFFGSQGHLTTAISSWHTSLFVLILGESSVSTLQSRHQRKENIIKGNWFPPAHDFSETSSEYFKNCSQAKCVNWHHCEQTIPPETLLRFLGKEREIWIIFWSSKNWEEICTVCSYHTDIATE